TPTFICGSSPAAAGRPPDRTERRGDTRLPGLPHPLSRRRARSQPTGRTHRPVRELRPYLAPAPASGDPRPLAGDAHRTGTRRAAATRPLAGAGSATTPAPPVGGQLGCTLLGVRVARPCRSRRHHRARRSHGDLAGGRPALRLGGAAGTTVRTRARAGGSHPGTYRRRPDHRG